MADEHPFPYTFEDLDPDVQKWLRNARGKDIIDVHTSKAGNGSPVATTRAAPFSPDSNLTRGPGTSSITEARAASIGT